MGFLKNLKSRNQFPIIFIGPGITQRYFKDAPTWDSLLQKIWREAKTEQTCFSRFNELKQKVVDNQDDIQAI